MTPRRSALFMPAHNERAITKARTLDCDVVILDLEDAVAHDTKQCARNTAKAAVIDGFGPREIAVRVNGIGTEWHTHDMTTFADAPLDALVVPKAELPADITRLGERMDALVTALMSSSGSWPRRQQASSMHVSSAEHTPVWVHS